MFPHPGPVNSPRREFPASDVCELRTNWEYQLLFRISSRGRPSSKCLCAEPPRFFSPSPVLARPGVNQIAITFRPLRALVGHNPPFGRSFRHHDRETFFFLFNSKVRAESKLFHHSFD